MNEMRLSTGFMNGVKSLFVLKLCLDNHNKVALANGPTHKNHLHIPMLLDMLKLKKKVPIVFAPTRKRDTGPNPGVTKTPLPLRAGG